MAIPTAMSRDRRFDLALRWTTLAYLGAMVALPLVGALRTSSAARI